MLGQIYAFCTKHDRHDAILSAGATPLTGEASTNDDRRPFCRAYFTPNRLAEQGRQVQLVGTKATVASIEDIMNTVS